MRDTSHMQKVMIWARYVKENPKEWRKQHTPFINSQIEKAQKFYEKLENTINGAEKIKKLRKQQQ